MVRRSLVVLLLAVACVASTAGGATAMTVGGEVFGAFNTHSMSDWNDEVVTPLNALGGNIDEFGNAFSGGLGLRMWPNTNWMVAATWEPLFMTKKESVTGLEFNTNANAFQATAGYFFPSTSQAKFGLGGGLGYYSLSGEVNDPSSPPAGKLTGSTVGFHFMGMMEWTASPGFAVTGSAGYRIAKISDTKLDDVSVQTSSGSDFATDYSGLMLRAGLAFYMPSSK